MSAEPKPLKWVLTTDEVESWRVNLGEHWAAVIGPLGHEVVIDGDRILATTRALEKLEAGFALWHGLPPDERALKAIEETGKLVRAATYRAEKAETERDAARAEGVELLEQRDRARRALASEIETTRATRARVSELETALRAAIVEIPSGLPGSIYANARARALAALNKTKEEL